MSRDDEKWEAVDVLAKSIVIDGSTVAIVNPWLEPSISQQFFDKMISGGVTASNVTVPSSGSPGSSLTEGIRQFKLHVEWIASAPEKAILVRDVEDLTKAKADGLAGIIFGPQNADILEDAVETVGLFHDLGLRVMQLTYNSRNLIGDGCMEPANAGLSRFGMDVVREMNDVGVVVDLSHCGDQTTLDAIDVSEKPCIFSHANARSVHAHPRNRTDDQIKAIAEKGGVICLLPYAEFLAPRESSPPKLDVLLRHVDHVANLVGLAHVGLSTDINENNETRRIWNRMQNPDLVGDARFHKYPLGFDGDFRNYHLMAEVLLEGGFAVEDVVGMLGGNVLRVFGEVW